MAIKVMSIFGTRPEAIKMAPVVKALEGDEAIESIVCVTAQHREMLDQVLEVFQITPDYDLDIMEAGQKLSGVTSKALLGIEKVIQEVKPDMVLVHGDTSTTFAGALAGFYNGVKVGHVEAGLRTHNIRDPFPEEANRKLTGVLADLHFAPTELSKENLLAEQVKEDHIFVTGNTEIDALEFTLEEDYSFQTPLLNNIDFENKKVIAMTAHRRENLGQPHENIFSAVKRVAMEIEDVEVIYPVHLNPLVKEPAHRILGGLDNVYLIDPLNIKEMHNLLNRSKLILTDSGGIQENAPSMGKPVLVLRNTTERPEGVEAGTLRLVGTNADVVFDATKELLFDEVLYNTMALAVNPYGDGKASRRIVEAIKKHFA